MKHYNDISVKVHAATKVLDWAAFEAHLSDDIRVIL